MQKYICMFLVFFSVFQVVLYTSGINPVPEGPESSLSYQVETFS